MSGLHSVFEILVFIIVGGEVHRAQQLVPYLIPPEEHHHVVVIVIRHQPLKALPVKINVPQGARRRVEGVGSLEERMELRIFRTERYVDRNVAYRYNATSVITVTSKNVDRVRKLMSGQAELLKQGIACLLYTSRCV